MKKPLRASLIFIAIFIFVSTSFVNAALEDRGSIRGTFYQDLDGNGICGSGDTAVAGFGIDFSSSDGSITISLVTGTNGTYGLVGSGLGTWTVQAVAPSSSWQITSANPVKVTIDASDPIATNIDFCVQGGGSAVTNQAQAATAAFSTVGITTPITTETLPAEVSGQPPSLDLESNFATSDALLNEPQLRAGLAYDDLEFFVRDGNRDVEIPPDQPDWLAYLNQFRETEHLPPVMESAAFTQGSFNHARFMVLNDVCCAHSQNPNNPLFTANGNDSGINGLIFSSTWTQSQMEHAINFWISAPFHLVGILDPAVSEVGFGEFRQETGFYHYAAVLDVRTNEVDSLEVPPEIEYPLFFPADGTETFVVRRSLPEYPDPLTAPGCTSYTEPTGPAIMMMMGHGDVTPNVTSHRVFENGRLIESCVFTETTYENPDQYTQQTGRTILDTRDAIVITPRLPLVGGATYRVEVAVNGEEYSWEFTARTKQ
ncbi:MAG: CAP domain-containing protein [Chloroflexota bacterium]